MLGLTGTGAFIVDHKETPKATVTRSSFARDESDFDSHRFKKMIMGNKHLVAIESEINEKVQKEKPKKKIVSYTANRDTLYIPHPERPKRPVDIRSNLIEEEKKIPMADIGMQSDKINYVSPDKPYIPQKIGKDAGVQIEDGDLFNFDRDVESILQVLCGKILEQSEVELMEEAEINNLRETKETLIKKFKAQKEEIKSLEEDEIRRKKENDEIMKMRRIIKLSKIDTQQKLVSRVFSKSFLSSFRSNTMGDLEKRGVFTDYRTVNIKDVMNAFILTKTEEEVNYNQNLGNTINHLFSVRNDEKKMTHQGKVKQHKELIKKKIEEREVLRKIEEERKRLEEIDRQEKRRLRQIRKVKESIKRQIFEVPLIKADYYNEEVNEIDNYENEGPFSKIFN